MVNEIKLTSYSSSVMIDTTFHVVHTNFEVDANMMMIYVSGENGTKWILDTMDYDGVSKLTIDGVVFSKEDTNQYLDFLNKVGVDYRKQIIESVEKMVEGFTDDQIDLMVTNKIKLPSVKSDRLIGREDVEKVCETINKYLYYDEVDEVVDRYHRQSENDNWSIVVEDLIYQVYSERK